MSATILVAGQSATVTDVIDHAPGEHPTSPIRDDLAAREWVTERGSRWSGLRPDGEPYNDPTRLQGRATQIDLIGGVRR